MADAVADGGAGGDAPPQGDPAAGDAEPGAVAGWMHTLQQCMRLFFYYQMLHLVIRNFGLNQPWGNDNTKPQSQARASQEHSGKAAPSIPPPSRLHIRPSFSMDEPLDVHVFVCDSALIPRRGDAGARCERVGSQEEFWPRSLIEAGFRVKPPVEERHKPEWLTYERDFDLPVTLWPHVERQGEAYPPPPPASPLASDNLEVTIGWNRNIYVHALFCRSGAPCFADDEDFNPAARFTAMQRLLFARRERIRRATRRLLSSDDSGGTKNESAPAAVKADDEDVDEEDGDHVRRYQLRTYYQPNVTFSLVIDSTVFRSRAEIPPQVGAFLAIDPVVETYKPVVYVNDFWTLREHHVGPLNESHFAPRASSVPPLRVRIGTMSLYRWQMQINMDHSLKMQRAMRTGAINMQPLGAVLPPAPAEDEESLPAAGDWEMVAGDDVVWDYERESLKRIFADTNPYYLALTMIVSLLHSIFDFLAFKNDVSFWREKNKNLRGISVRSLVVSAGSSLIILLYLFDHEGETSYLILFSNGVGTLIEFWKLSRVVAKVRWRRVGDMLLPPPLAEAEGDNPVSSDAPPPPAPPTGMTRLLALYLPFVRLPELQFKESYEKSETEEYDAIATKYLCWALYPLVLCYAGYSLYYHTHKGVYSFIINTLVGCVYTFGFITMCPQLYINYRLKSVSHLPWKQLTYRFLNTIVDDVFSFLIPMPFMHRLAVFRDDVVFLIYLYQRWIYRIDYKRANEYGFVSAEGKKPEQEQLAGNADDAASERGRGTEEESEAKKDR